MKQWPWVVAFFGLLSLASTVQADTSLMTCTQSGVLQRKCLVHSQKLLDTIRYKGVAYESEYRIRFTFSCRGDGVNFGFSADTEHRSVAAVKALATEQYLTLPGSGDLWVVDPQPTVTEGLNFRAPCAFTFHAVSQAPTNNTAELWRREEKTQADLVARTSFLVGVLSNFASYREWDQQTTQTVLSSVRAKETSYQRTCDDTADEAACDAAFDLSLVRRTLENKIAYDPSRPEYHNAAVLYEQLLTVAEGELADLKLRRETWGVPE